MPTLNSQVIYNWSGGSQPIKPGEWKEDTKLVSFSDFSDAMQSSEEAMTQKITQDNAEALRVLKLVNDANLQTLDSSATLSQCIEEINKINSILTNLVSNGKNR